MKIHRSIDEFCSDKKTIVTIGTFDGVHQGHQQIIKRLTDNAVKLQAESVILTFFPHPRMVLSGDEVQMLNTIDEKIELLEKFGIDHLIIHPFDNAFSELSPQEFVREILVSRLGTKKILLGHDHRFGKNRSAGMADLVKFAALYDFEVEQLAAEEVNAIAISSTKIRRALTEGDIKLSNSFLGYPYFFSGKVVQGRKIGRTIGFPTANIEIREKYKLIPKSGVYLVRSKIGYMMYFGLMNIGIKPTIDDSKLTIEVFFIDLDIDLYGKKLRIEMLDHVRDEVKFASLDALRQQITEDLQWARNQISS